MPGPDAEYPCLDCANAGRQSKLQFCHISVDEAILICPNEKCVFPLNSPTNITLFKRSGSLADKTQWRYELVSTGLRTALLSPSDPEDNRESTAAERMRSHGADQYLKCTDGGASSLHSSTAVSSQKRGDIRSTDPALFDLGKSGDWHSTAVYACESLDGVVEKPISERETSATDPIASGYGASTLTVSCTQPHCMLSSGGDRVDAAGDSSVLREDNHAPLNVSPATFDETGTTSFMKSCSPTRSSHSDGVLTDVCSSVVQDSGFEGANVSSGSKTAVHAVATASEHTFSNSTSPVDNSFPFSGLSSDDEDVVFVGPGDSTPSLSIYQLDDDDDETDDDGEEDDSEYWSRVRCQYLQWKNADALCWLDVILCTIVHCLPVVNLYRALPVTSVSGSPLMELLHTYYRTMSDVCAGHVQQKPLLSPNQKGTLAMLRTGGGCSASLSPGHIAASNGMHTALHYPAFEPAGPCHIGEGVLALTVDALDEARDKLWRAVQSQLQYEKGTKGSPVLAFPVVLKLEPDIKSLFTADFSWVLQCKKCRECTVDRCSTVVATLPTVPKSFHMTRRRCFLRPCTRCNAPNQERYLKFIRLSDVFMLHFASGVSQIRDLRAYGFTFDHRRYTVSAIVQYKSPPDHFVVWFRDETANKWMECDDLGHPVCQYIWDMPRIKPDEVHIVVWTPSTLVCREKKSQRSSPPCGRRERAAAAKSTPTSPKSPPAGSRRRSKRLRANRTAAASSGTTLSANDFDDTSSLDDTDEEVSPTSDTAWSARGSQKPRRQQQRRTECTSREPSPKPSRERSPPSQPPRNQHERRERPQKCDGSDRDPSIVQSASQSPVCAIGSSGELEQQPAFQTPRSVAIGSAAAAEEATPLNASASTSLAGSKSMATLTAAGSASKGGLQRPARPKWSAVLNQRLAPWQVAAEKLNLVQPQPTTPTTALSWPDALHSTPTGVAASPAAPTTYYELVKPLLGKRIACVAKANTYAAYEPKPTAAKQSRWRKAAQNEQSVPQPAPRLTVPLAVPSGSNCFPSSISATSPTLPPASPRPTQLLAVSELSVDRPDHCAMSATSTAAAAAFPTTVPDQWNLGLLDDLEL